MLEEKNLTCIPKVTGKVLPNQKYGYRSKEEDEFQDSFWYNALLILFLALMTVTVIFLMIINGGS